MNNGAEVFRAWWKSKIWFPYKNRVVPKHQFTNDFSLQQQNAEHFARLVRQPTWLPNKSNIFLGRSFV
jgi:hypothetical protein